MEKLQKCVNFILTVPVFFATSCNNVRNFGAPGIVYLKKILLWCIYYYYVCSSLPPQQ
jgi:hypothetical protein